MQAGSDLVGNGLMFLHLPGLPNLPRSHQVFAGFLLLKGEWPRAAEPGRKFESLFPIG